MVLDPLEALTFAAAHTKRIALGDERAGHPLLQPGHASAPLDHTRLPFQWTATGGVGAGLVEDEMDAVSADMKQRGARWSFKEGTRTLPSTWRPSLHPR
jgi:hypothetical protein